jgi:hypothetical protein
VKYIGSIMFGVGNSNKKIFQVLEKDFPRPERVIRQLADE